MANESASQKQPQRPSSPHFPSYLPSLRAQIGLAVLSGVLLGFSHPFVIEAVGPHPIDPTGLSGLLVFVGWVPVFYLVRTSTVKRTFWLFFIAHVVKFTLVLWWLTVAMNVFGKIPLPIAVFLLGLLAVTLSAPLSAALAGGRMVCERYDFPFWIVGPSIFGAAELVRNYGLLGGFPWGNDAYALTTLPIMIQVAAWVGVYGLALMIFFINAGLAEACVAFKTKSPWPRRPLGVAAGLLAFIVLFGAVRLATAEDPASVERTLKVALLQGNIEQGIKNNERLHRKTILARYWALQAEAIAQGADIVVWPEASVPVSLNALAKNLKDTHVVDRQGEHAGIIPPAAIIGASAGEVYYDETVGKKRRRRYNTVFATEQNLKVKGRFDKGHLVPFGEFVPWPFRELVKHLVPGLTTPGEKFTPAIINTSQGPVSVGATVCYEGAFPEITLAYTKQGAELMFNVTNDAWYGISSMTWQHTYMYAMRAVESGRPIARAANTGVSAWVDNRGVVHDTSAMYETTVVLASIPLAITDTVYATVREIVCLPPLIIILGLWFYALMGFRFWERERHLIEWVIGAGGFLFAAFITLRHWVLLSTTTDAITTQHQIYFVFGMLIGLSAWSGRIWGRFVPLILAAVSGLFAFVALIYFDEKEPLLMALATTVVAGLALKRGHAYTQPEPVPRAGPWAPPASQEELASQEVLASQEERASSKERAGEETDNG